MENPFLSPLPFSPPAGLSAQGEKTVNTHPVIYPFLQRMEGYKTNLKGHHWHGYNHSTHVQIDEFLDDVSEAQDAIAEVSMNVYGIMTLGFESIPSNNWDIMSLTANIINDFIFVNGQLESEPQNLGLLNQIQDSIQEMQNRRYLIELAYKGQYK